MALDSLDGRIILALDKDPEASALALSRTLGVARNTVHARLARLERSGALRSFSRRLDPAALGYELTAFLSLSISQTRTGSVEDGLAAIPEVIEVHTTTGDADLMGAAVTDRTTVILLCTPNNPTGVPISHDRLEAFLQSVRSDVLVVIDEAYVEYAGAGSGPGSLALYRRYPNVCILRTFSKAYGLAGLRVGYAITTAAIAEGLRRTALPFAVSTLAPKAAIASLDAGEEMAARVGRTGKGAEEF
ncbi:aminotransferase class I/II-fold pyridoxal phosphate-dependent enzyme [Paenarthrobacter sp. NEAU-H11]|uniref:aminotransferase class I/II-fold pyridoxal phosphate-dependent enzyme n=1 Tax=Paenarthrobacter sp. NEAU-H11 TaxID=3423924 RepID=UPI003D32B63C